jgi:preprotein translocase subunit SecD
MFGTGILVMILYYAVVVAILAVVLYFVVRLAVLHALKAHTNWIDGGKQ